MEYHSVISQRGTIQLPPALLSDMGIQPDSPIEMHTKPGKFWEIRLTPMYQESPVSKRKNTIEDWWNNAPQHHLEKSKPLDVDKAIEQAIRERHDLP